MSKTTTITLTDSARAVVILNTKADRIVYSAYITEHGVTLDTVSEHVQALAALAVDMRAVDGEDKMAVKCFKNRVRNGLNRNLGKEAGESKKSDKFVTAEGLKAESWDAFVAKAKAEWDAANSK